MKKDIAACITILTLILFTGAVVASTASGRPIRVRGVENAMAELYAEYLRVESNKFCREFDQKIRDGRK